MYATPFDQPPRPATGAGFGRRRHAGGGGEVVVRSWKHVLQAEELVSGRGGRTTSPARPVGRRGAVQGATGDQALAGRDDATDVIAGCKDDMKALWGDDVVHEVLARQKVKLADSAELSVPISSICYFVLSLLFMKKQLFRPTRSYCEPIVPTFRRRCHQSPLAHPRHPRT